MREVHRDPIQGGKVEVALLYIAVKRCEFVRPYVQRDPNSPQHRLHRFAEPPPLGRGLVDETQIAYSGRTDWIAGLVEEPRGLERIVRVAHHVVVVGPVLWRKHPARHAAAAFVQRADDRLAVDRIRYRLAHAEIAQMRIAEVQRQIVIFAAGRLIDYEIGPHPEIAEQVRLNIVFGQVADAFGQLQRADRRVGHYLEDDSGHLARRMRPRRIASEHQRLVAREAGDLEGTAGGRPSRGALARQRRPVGDHAYRRHLQRRGVWPFGRV